MQNTIAILGALIGAVVLSILVGLLRRDPEGRLRPGDLLAAAVAGAIMGGLIAYAAVPAPNPLVPAPVEDAAAPAVTPPEAAMEPAVGTPQSPPSATAAPAVTDAPKPVAKHAAAKPKPKHVASTTPVNVPPPGGAGTCREYTTKILIEGTMQDAHGTTCQQADGTWQKVQ